MLKKPDQLNEVCERNIGSDSWEVDGSRSFDFGRNCILQSSNKTGHSKGQKNLLLLYGLNTRGRNYGYQAWIVRLWWPKKVAKCFYSCKVFFLYFAHKIRSKILPFKLPKRLWNMNPFKTEITANFEAHIVIVKMG